MSQTISWRSPSNIALVKYWGKHGVQLPRNPSISFTLQNAYTETRIDYATRSSGAKQNIDLQFFFEGQANEAFGAKQARFLESLLPTFPFLGELSLVINSHNSFPHSAGIASSASSMSALALCLCSIEQDYTGRLASEDEFLDKASFIARLGSGSACRSVYPHLAAWGKSSALLAGSDEVAVPCSNIVNPLFRTYHDDILLVSAGEKSISSRAGHGLMVGNPFAQARYTQANDNFMTLLGVLRDGDLERFTEIVENEALTLHALMMSSYPSFILLQPNSLAIIEKIKNFRYQTDLPVCFTIDAGPNIHLLYPDDIAEKVQPFIQSELLPLCENGRMIADCVGNGPVLVIN